jgi:hypothetical protein
MKTTDKNGNKIETTVNGVKHHLDYTTKKIDMVPAKSWVWRESSSYEVLIAAQTKKLAIEYMNEHKKSEEKN